MEGGVHRGRWNKNAPVGTILLLMCMFTVTLTLVQHPEEQSQPTEKPKCQDDEYLTEEGACCNKCHPGYKLVEVCRATGQRSKCDPCPDGQYMDRVNYAPRCKACTRCKGKYDILVSKCAKDRNTICRCVDGFFRSYINSDTYDCLRCTECDSNAQIYSTCTPERDTVCECKKNYYRVKNKCVPCKNCSNECGHLCAQTGSTTSPNLGKNDLINIIAGVVGVSLVMLVLVAIVTYVVTKWLTKKKLLKSSFQPSDESTDSCEQGLISEGPSYINSDKAAPPSLESEEEQLSNLPDCVPAGVNYPNPFPSIPTLIYTVLDLVPVPQMKQLVRSLGVTDTEIEQAERDHRSCREAHYQMLRAWAERGSRAGGMQHLRDELRKMHLERAAEELETKYCIQ